MYVLCITFMISDDDATSTHVEPPSRIGVRKTMIRKLDTDVMTLIALEIEARKEKHEQQMQFEK